ncbi:MAG: FAD binding domain-containing protein, partial [Deltaproteobacteria bacterium]|nr:FAD binding domain-containing protein [Deltaproteobacteria bacterium]
LKMGGDRCYVVGGRKCFSNYCSDIAPALLSLEAEVKLTGPEGERKIPLHELYTGKGEKPFNLVPGEIMTAVLIPDVPTKGAYEKLRLRNSIDYPLLGVGFSVADWKGRLAIGALGPKPFLEILNDLTKDDIERAAQRASGKARPIENTTVSPLYRKKMVKVLAMKVMREFCSGA